MDDEKAGVFALYYSSVYCQERFPIPRLVCFTPKLPAEDNTVSEVFASFKALITSQSPNQPVILKGMNQINAATFVALFTHFLVTGDTS